MQGSVSVLIMDAASVSAPTYLETTMNLSRVFVAAVEVMNMRCLLFAMFLPFTGSAAADTAVRWWEPYSGDEANGAHVLGLWKFDNEDLLNDESSHGHTEHNH